MAVTSGFYNSVNGDRRYNAEQMSAIFDGIINDGIFASVGTAFAVSVNNGLTVNVGVGRAWFNSTWIYNDAVLPITLAASEIVMDRIDSVVIEVNHEKEVRAASIKIVKGTASQNPVAPTLTNTDDVHQYLLAQIRVNAGVSSLAQANITNHIGTTTPYVTGILDVVSIEHIVAQWQSQWEIWYESITVDGYNDIMEWFNSIKGVLGEDPAVELANRILVLEEEVAEVYAVVPSFEALSEEFTALQTWVTNQSNNFQEQIEDLKAEAGEQITQIQNQINTLSGTLEAIQGILDYSQTDLTAGSSALATGHVYLVYE